MYAEAGGSELKAYLRSKRSCEFTIGSRKLTFPIYDPTLHEKMDKTLGPGLLAFRNGRLLELDTDKPSVCSLAPTDYVSVAGGHCRPRGPAWGRRAHRQVAGRRAVRRAVRQAAQELQ